MKIIYSLIMIFFVALGYGQTDPKFPSNEEEYTKQYERNILKTKINGVYIPQNEEEAFEQLTKLSDQDSWDKFRSGPEEVVVEKLKLGLGRWMELNWNFYEGSRLSQYLKSKGLLHPEDMAKYLMIYYHRKLNEVSMDEKAIIASISESRRKKLQKEIDLYKIETSPISKKK